MRICEMSVSDKVIFVVSNLLLFAVIVLLILDLANILENGLNYALLLIGIRYIAQGIGEWKNQRRMAVFSFIVGTLIIILELVILFILAS